MADNLPPQLTLSQLQGASKDLASQGAPREVVQSFVDNYHPDGQGNYVLKGSQDNQTTEPTPESQGAVKQANGTYRAPTFLEGLGEVAKGAANFVGSQAIDLGQTVLKAGQQRETPLTKAMGIDVKKNNAKSNAAIQTGSELKAQMAPKNQAQQGGATAANVGEVLLPLAAPAANLIENAPKILSSAKSLATGAKELIKPSLSTEEQVGKIIQGKLGDIPPAQRTFNALPQDIKTISKMNPQELSTTIQENVIQKNLNKVDTYFANDNTLHPMSSFNQTVGEGASKVKTNYVKQAIDQLKEFYAKINDAQGLSDIKALEKKAIKEGLSSQELNNLAKEHGSVINAFNANGEAASGLSKQAAENTRSGVKATARNVLSKSSPEAAAEATRLDKETADAIKTKNLLDNQVEKGNTIIQKKGKTSKVVQLVKKHPVISSAVGAVVANKLTGGKAGEILKSATGL